MTPAARFAAAIDVLEAWNAGTPAEAALTAWARAARYAGSKDRRAVRDIVYDILRQKGRCAANGGGDGARALALGLARMTGADIDMLFSGAGYGPAPLNIQERSLLAQPLAVDRHLDLPKWLFDLLTEQYGAALDPILDAMAHRAPVYLRVNTGRADREAAILALAAEGVTALPEESCATALKVTENAARVAQSDALARGLVEIQDLSVQLACASVDWPGQGRILDYCAGGGGKALAIAAATGGPVHVHDAHPQRMADLPRRAARAGADLPAFHPGAGPFDVVLCDVPCSGSGTWRRDPETKWRLTPAELTRLSALQAEILEAALPLVAPGGRLVYMTCSLLADENEARIAAFLAGHPEWRHLRSAAFLPPAASDGFFVAELARP